VSHLGSAKEVWELCIPLMGEMALTRNLRNFEQSGISKESWEKVYERMLAVEDSVQLPFRFFSAERCRRGILQRLQAYVANFSRRSFKS
jgi:hypothetical protein